MAVLDSKSLPSYCLWCANCIYQSIHSSRKKEKRKNAASIKTPSQLCKLKFIQPRKYIFFLFSSTPDYLLNDQLIYLLSTRSSRVLKIIFDVEKLKNIFNDVLGDKKGTFTFSKWLCDLMNLMLNNLLRRFSIMIYQTPSTLVCRINVYMRLFILKKIPIYTAWFEPDLGLIW